MKSKKLWLIAFKLAVIAAFAVVITLPAAGQGDRQKVRGTWFGTGTNACLVAGMKTTPAFTPGSGFTNNLTPTDGVSFQTSSAQVSLNINPDGTGTGTFDEFALTPLTIPSTLTYPPASGVSASSTTGTFSFTYTIADDGTLTVTFLSLGGQVLSGPSKGAAFSVLPPRLIGRIGKDGKSMLLSSATPPTVETLYITNTPVFFDRICNRTRVFVPIHEDEQDKD
jgi:hypothetical protein